MFISCRQLERQIDELSNRRCSVKVIYQNVTTASCYLNQITEKKPDKMSKSRVCTHLHTCRWNDFKMIAYT
jgi:hypothetical protein